MISVALRTAVVSGSADSQVGRITVITRCHSASTDGFADHVAESAARYNLDNGYARARTLALARVCRLDAWLGLPLLRVIANAAPMPRLRLLGSLATENPALSLMPLPGQVGDARKASRFPYLS